MYASKLPSFHLLQTGRSTSDFASQRPQSGKERGQSADLLNSNWLGGISCKKSTNLICRLQQQRGATQPSRRCRPRERQLIFGQTFGSSNNQAVDPPVPVHVTPAHIKQTPIRDRNGKGVHSYRGAGIRRLPGPAEDRSASPSITSEGIGSAGDETKSLARFTCRLSSGRTGNAIHTSAAAVVQTESVVANPFSGKPEHDGERRQS